MLPRLFPNVYEGWIVTGSFAFAFVIVLVGATFFYGFGTVFNPVEREMGWSKAAVAFGFSLRSEMQGIGAPAIGFLVDRFGPRRVLLAGILVMVAGVLRMSYMQSLWQFYVSMFVIAFGISAAGGPVGMAAVAIWFERRRARALSFMTARGAVAGLFVVVVAWLVETFGWRNALRFMALLIVIVGTLATLNVRSRPLNHHQPLDGIPSELRTVPAEGAGRSRSARREWSMLHFHRVVLSISDHEFALWCAISHRMTWLRSNQQGSASRRSLTAFPHCSRPPPVSGSQAPLLSIPLA